MVNAIRNLAISWMKGLVEILLYFPVLLLFVPLSRIGEAFPYWIAGLTIFLPLGVLVRLLVRSDLRLIQIVIGAVVVASASLLVYGNDYSGWIAVLFGGVLYFHGFGSVRTNWQLRFTPGMMWVGLFLYLVAGVILPRIDSYASYSSVLGWLGVVSVVVTLFLSNTSNLKEETQSGSKDVRLASGVLLKNRALTLIILALVLGIGLIGPIMRAFIWLKDWVKSLIIAFLGLFDREEKPIPEEPLPTPASAGMGLPESEGPSAFGMFMDKLMIYVGYVLVLIVIAFLVYVISRVIYRAVKALIERLLARSRDAATGIQDYEEEKATLVDWKELRRQYGDRLAGIFSRRDREPGWDTLDANGKVRSLYRMFVQRNVHAGQSFESHKTPRETLTTSKDGVMSAEERLQLADAYNRARYGSKEVDDELTSRLKRNSGL